MRQYYKDGYDMIYNVLVQHVCTSGPGSNIILYHKNIKNGNRCYLDLKVHFLINSHDHTKAQNAEKKISEYKYSEGIDTWKMRTNMISYTNNLMSLSNLVDYMNS